MCSGTNCRWVRTHPEQWIAARYLNCSGLAAVAGGRQHPLRLPVSSLFWKGPPATAPSYLITPNPPLLDHQEIAGYVAFPYAALHIVCLFLYRPFPSSLPPPGSYKTYITLNGGPLCASVEISWVFYFILTVACRRVALGRADC